jgi:hypothetical protein
MSDTVRGRAFVTADSVFVPLRWGLVRLSLGTGRQEESYPRDGAWNSDDMRLRATYRMAYRPDFVVAANGGFRCAAAAPES